METLPNVTEKHVELCIRSPTQSIDLIRELLCAEAGRQEINPNKISVSSNIYSKDGGVDAVVYDVSPKFPDGLLLENTTYYQIKWGKSFDPKNLKDIEGELLNSSGELSEQLKKLGSEDGNYGLIWFGGNFKSNELEICENNIKKVFSDKGYSNVKVIVVDRQGIAQHCTMYPVIQSRFFNQLHEYFLTLKIWKQNFKKYDEKEEEVLTNYHGNIISDIQKCCLMPNYNPLQLLGFDQERIELNRLLVYQALKQDVLAQKTICINADELIPPLSTTLQTREDLNQIVVIDNCEEKHYEKILQILGDRKNRLNFILILKNTNPLIDARFLTFGRYGIENSPFMKEIINKKNNQNTDESSFKYVKTVPKLHTFNLAPFYVTTFSDIAREYGYDVLNQTRKLLRFISLFSHIKTDDNMAELQCIAEQIGFQKDSVLTLAEQIHILKKFRLVNGTSILKIKDKHFRSVLIQECWEIYGSLFDFEKFLLGIYSYSENFAYRIVSSFRYITTSENGAKLADSLLGTSGIFANGDLLDDYFGSSLFSELAKANPDLALLRLKETLGTWDLEKLSKFQTGRRDIVNSLENMAWWENLFHDATSLLLKLAEAENEIDISNNATGIFKQLFSPGFGAVAMSEASPQKRLSILKEIFESSSEKQHRLALEACNEALESRHLTKFVAGEEPSHGRKHNPWMPKTYGELYDAYTRTWTFLENQIKKLDGSLEQNAVKILCNHCRALIPINELSKMIIETLSRLSKEEKYKEQVVNGLVSIIRYEKKNLPENTFSEINSIHDEIVGTTFTSHLQRYVKMNIDFENFAIDEFSKESIEKMKQIAQKSITNPSLIEKELSWLVALSNQKSFDFGVELGKLDEQLQLSSKIIDEQKKIGMENLVLICGYFRGFCEKYPSKFDSVIETLESDTITKKWLPKIIFHARALTDKDSERILNFAHAGEMELNQFNMFCYGGSTRNLSDEYFQKWIDYLLNNLNDDVLSTLIMLYNFYYLSKGVERDLPEELTLQIINEFLARREIISSSKIDDFSFTEICKRFVEKYSNRSLDIVQSILNFISQNNTHFSLHRELEEIFDHIAKEKPEEIWGLISDDLINKTNRTTFVYNWLANQFSFSQDSGSIKLFPSSLLIGWIDEDPEQRAILLSSIIPISLENNEDSTFVKEILTKYGHLDKVRSGMIGNYLSGGFSGSISKHYQQKREKLKEFGENEENENIKTWISECDSSLNYEIDKSKSSEEIDY